MSATVESIDQVDVTEGYYAMIVFFGQVYTLRFKDSNGTVIDTNREAMLERAEAVPRPWPWYSRPIIERVVIESDGAIRSEPLAGKAIARTKSPSWDPDGFRWVRLK